ncbi:MAG TPA: universal stress protein, partial [Dehalococcoidia bacterium]|nr:universal stress protein [Dehalococcoidia bacterium]
MKILIPLDGSSFGEAILDVARRVARLTGAEVHMLQVRDPLEHPVAFEQTGSFRNIVDATGAPVAGSLSFAPDEGLEENYQQLVQQAEREAIDYLEGKGREFAGS